MATFADPIGRWTPPPQGTPGGAGSGFAGAGGPVARGPLTPMEISYLWKIVLQEDDTACSAERFLTLQENECAAVGHGNRTAAERQQYEQHAPSASRSCDVLEEASRSYGELYV